MGTNNQGRKVTVNGLTFTVLEGGRKKTAADDFNTLIEEIYPKLLRSLAYKAGVHPDAVLDALHDVLVHELQKARKGAPRFGIRHLKSYLKTSALREYWRLMREKRRMIPISDLGDDGVAMLLEGKATAEPAPLDILITQEMARLAKDQLERLPLRQRHVLGRWSGGLTIPEIALEADTTAGNVRFHKHAAVHALRKKFGMEAEETA
jgi:DNA-directed RNA polymerase specialized sigma24 family protein